MQPGELRKIEPQIVESGFQIITVSPDLPERVRQTSDALRITYQLLSDSKMTAARALGVAFILDDKRYEKYISLGADLEKVSGEKHHQLPAPAVFILDGNCVMQFEYVNPNYKIRLSPDVLLAATNVALKK